MAAALVAVLVTTACSLGRPADDASGEEIYRQLCARCHGIELDGGIAPSLGAGSISASEGDEYLEFSILNGRGRMPSFSSSLDGAQLDRLVEYMRQVQSR